MSTDPNPPTSAWGERQTRFFYDLTPDRILDAVETSGLRCTGRCLQLNSMENRVYEVEIEADRPELHATAPERFRVAKFYRPGRWTQSQIEAEHQFLLDLQAAEIPAIIPLHLNDGKTVGSMPDTGIFFAIFAKIGGRNPDELNELQLRSVGRLLARLHGVGALREAPERIRLDPETYGWDNLDWLLEMEVIPEEIEDRYAEVVEEIADRSFPWFEAASFQRIHGDAHLGNLLWNDQGPFWVDFDDMVMGPPVQDLWLIAPGRDNDSRRNFSILLEAYCEMEEFDRSSLRLIEPLRALRYVHFSAWIARRWEDVAFQRKFEFFGSDRYWREQLADLEESLFEIRNQGLPGDYDS